MAITIIDPLNFPVTLTEVEEPEVAEVEAETEQPVEAEQAAVAPDEEAKA